MLCYVFKSHGSHESNPLILSFQMCVCLCFSVAVLIPSSLLKPEITFPEVASRSREEEIVKFYASCCVEFNR